ncbi:unnamed protein product [Adineta steineri]|uniref:F-box domain-containing protein n=1 Tax=Adineta steineri TaxID=433720 RepID=A0A819ZEV6_9BILA|nr:unnamed protein product [Adineta steineri]CAF4173287.1 unnamed protein product [Adineta steineri]
MSLSKLESLPNEILLDLFEKCIDGIDIFVAFIHQFNSRFDALLSQCQQLYFNFIGCRLDNFRFCIHLLPNYLNKITGLALSERGAPGQINMFLKYFPSFTPFKQLRSLYIHCSAEYIHSNHVENAILSLVLYEDRSFIN